MSPQVFSPSQLANLASTSTEFPALIADVPYERKGILYSEMLFLALCARRVKPTRILESGRARGQSTLILARLFPDLPIISIEHDPNSPDVEVAAARLANLPNVDLRFGDSTQLLPAILQSGDIVLIDGPKGLRGLRLALRLLATGKAPLVFVHDNIVGGVERSFLDRHYPSACYSDHPDFALAAHSFDKAAEPLISGDRSFSNTYPKAGYGFGLACLPYDPSINYLALRLRAGLARFSKSDGGNE